MGKNLANVATLLLITTAASCAWGRLSAQIPGLPFVHMLQPFTFPTGLPTEAAVAANTDAAVTESEDDEQSSAGPFACVDCINANQMAIIDSVFGRLSGRESVDSAAECTSAWVQSINGTCAQCEQYVAVIELLTNAACVQQTGDGGAQQGEEAADQPQSSYGNHWESHSHGPMAAGANANANGASLPAVAQVFVNVRNTITNIGEIELSLVSSD